MGFFDPTISIPRVTYRRFWALVEELNYLEEGESLKRYEMEEQIATFITRILDEYIRQHFKESTKVAANLLHEKRTRRIAELQAELQHESY